MALVKKRSNSSQLIVITTIIIVVGVVGYFLVQQFYLKPVGPDAGTTKVDRSTHVIKNFGEDILQDSRYRALQQYGTEPVPPSGSNPNPFQ